MTDNELAEIEALTDGGRDLKALDRYLRDKEANMCLYVPQAAAGDRCIKRHVVLRDTRGDDRVTSVEPTAIWWDLAGSGEHYNGLFGPLNSWGTPVDLVAAGVNVMPARRTATALPAAELAAQCVRWLASPISRSKRTLVPRIQKLLSEVLLDHPVLVHPGFLCPTTGPGDIGVQFMSVAHAIAHSRCAQLPMLGHFGESLSAPSRTSGVLERLRAFAAHPCVILGLQKGLAIRPNSKGVHCRETAPQAGLLKRAPAMFASRFVVSLMALDDIARDATHEVAPVRDAAASPQERASALPLDPGDAEYRKQWLAWLSASLQGAFFDACKLDPNGLDHEVLGALRRRSESLFAANVSLGNLDYALFGAPGLESTEAEIARDTDRICRGVALAGMRASRAGGTSTSIAPGTADERIASAAAHVLESAIGRHRVERSVYRSLPTTTPEGAIAFLKVIDDLGGFGSMSPGADGASPASRVYKRISLAVEERAALSISQGPPWRLALQTFWAEKAMTHVIDGATAAAATSGKPDAEVTTGAQSVCAAPARGPRLGL